MSDVHLLSLHPRKAMKSFSRPRGVHTTMFMEEHFDACVEILGETEYWRYPGCGTAADELRYLFESPASLISLGLSRVAVDSSGVVAFVLVARRVPWFDLKPSSVFVTDLAVRSSARRSGLGGWLLTQVFDSCLPAGIVEVCLQVHDENVSARSLYASLGFLAVDATVQPIPGDVTGVEICDVAAPSISGTDVFESSSNTDGDEGAGTKGAKPQ